MAATKGNGLTAGNSQPVKKYTIYSADFMPLNAVGFVSHDGPECEVSEILLTETHAASFSAMGKTTLLKPTNLLFLGFSRRCDKVHAGAQNTSSVAADLPDSEIFFASRIYGFGRVESPIRKDGGKTTDLF